MSAAALHIELRRVDGSRFCPAYNLLLTQGKPEMPVRLLRRDDIERDLRFRAGFILDHFAAAESIAQN